MKRLPVLACLLLLLAACTPAMQPDASGSAPTAATVAATGLSATGAATESVATIGIATATAATVPTGTPAPADTSRPESTATAAPTAETDPTYGRNEDGTFYYGAVDAPVTVTDYSDFL